MSSSVLSILRFEIGYHVRRPTFWLIALVYAVFGLADVVSNGSRGNAFFFINSPSQIFQTTVWYTLFSVLAATAFVAETFVRDARCGMEALVLATPVRKFDYVAVRFLGAFAVSLLAFSCYLPAMVLGTLVPGLNPYAIGPLRPEAYALSYLSVAVPNLLFVSVFSFVVTSRTRSIVAAYVGAIVLVMLYIAAMLMVGIDSLDETLLAWWSVLDPYGYFALEAQTQAWTVHQHNTAVPTLEGSFARNRALWLGLSLLIWALAYRFFDMRPTALTQGTSSGGWFARRRRRAGEGAVLPAPLGQGGVPTSTRAVKSTPLGWRDLPRLARFEFGLVLRSDAFRLLTFCGVVSLFFAASGSRSFEHSNPSTDILIHAASLYFNYVLFAIVVLYAAELVWRDRDVGIQGVVDATPQPNWLMVLSKLATLFAVITLNLLLCMLVLAGYQVANGYYEFEWLLSAKLLFLVHGPYFYCLAVLALFLQAVTRHKYAGMGLVLLIALSSIVLDAFGLFHNLYRFGATNDIGYSPMNGHGGLFEGHLWFVGYWAAFCAVLVMLTCLAWPRGSLDGGAARWRSTWATPWRQAPRPLQAGLGLGLTVTAALGGWIFYNTAVLNPYQPPGKDLLAVNHERLFKQYEHLPMPVVVKTEVKVDLFPADRRFIAKGRYLLENRTGQPIREIHLSAFINLKLVDVRYPGARLAKAFPEWGYYIYQLDTPLLPGAQASLDFVTRTEAPQGFLNQVDSDDVYMIPPNEVVHNGTSLYSPFILPFVGYTKMVEHKEAWLRDKHGLPPLDQRMRPHGDPTGRRQAMMLSHLAWGRTELIASTSADQAAVSSGLEVRRWQDDGRRYVHYRSDVSDRGKFTLYSARYQQVRDTSYRVPIEVFHHPAHAANVPAMTKHLGQAFTLYERLFGAYPFQQLRLAEFAYYPGMVFSEGGTIGLPEVLVWKADLRGDGEDAMIGWLAYLLGHAWWEDQIILADVAGAMTVREAISGYASNLYRRSIYTPARFVQIKRKQMREFFRLLGKVDFQEPPLSDVYNEVAVARFKGQMVLEQIEGQIGQPALLAALRQFLDQHRGQPAPYATVLDLRDAILSQTPLPLRPAIGELFSSVITYQLAVGEGSYTLRADGSHRVRLRIDSRKLYTRRLGEQQGADADLPLDIALLDDRGQTITTVRWKPTAQQAWLDMVVPRRPHKVVLDPLATLPTANAAGHERILKAGSV